MHKDAGFRWGEGGVRGGRQGEGCEGVGERGEGGKETSCTRTLVSCGGRGGARREGGRDEGGGVRTAHKDAGSGWMSGG